MKKWIWILVLAVLLAGCGGQKEKTAQTQTVGLCVRSRAEAPEYYEAIEQALVRLGCEVTVFDCVNDQARQDEKVAELVESCRLLVIEPVMVTALDSVINSAKQANVPVVFFDRQPELEGHEQLYYVGVDMESAGKKQAALLDRLENRGDLNGDGVVSCVILRGPEDHLDAKTVTEACTASLTGARVLETVAAQWTLEDARAQCAQTLARLGPDVEVILCNSPELTRGAVEAVQNGGWTPGQDIYVLGMGEGIDGASATVWLPLQDRVSKIAELAHKVLSGEASEKYTFVEYVS